MVRVDVYVMLEGRELFEGNEMFEGRNCLITLVTTCNLG